ncbi:unnamed protein product [Schistosoma margrebowiei]|uniref:Uncharacterized protein n=1 Tax=Schistosoma margrebowiei TaxID=48269 RepID=A0A183MW09_9TREM|nr:unnamed protein product [Schistosoma margrebowiei]
MTLPSDRLHLLFEQHLELLVKFRTQLLNQSRYEDATEVDELISELHSELENDSSLHESSINCTSNETAVIHDAPSGPVFSIPETCPVMNSNSVIPETACTDSNISSLRDIIALPENVFHASNYNQEPGIVLLDSDYHIDPLPTKDLIPDDLELNGVYPQYLIAFTGFPVQCVLNTIKLIVIWVYEDPTLIRGGGWAQKKFKIRISTPDLQKREVFGYSGKYPKNYPVKPNAIPGHEMVSSYWSLFI